MTGKKIKSAGVIISVLFLINLGGRDNAHSAWRQEWEQTIEGAQQEGQINVYLTYSGILGTFQKAYPAIRVRETVGRSAQIAQRILAERRSGKYLADAEIGGGANALLQFLSAKMIDPIRPLLALPEVVDESKWWRGRHRYLDPEGRYIFAFVGVPNAGSVNYNSNFINPKEFKSLWDFVHPKWKGKMVARDPRAPGPGGGAMRFFYYHPDLGPRFLTRLFGEMELTLTRDERQATDWLAVGKFPICFFCRDIDKAKRQGLPVDKFGVLKEGAGITSQGDTIVLLHKAPHPNAAKVFINWLLSREGQIAYQKAVAEAQGGGAPDSLRIDIPKDDVWPEERRREGVPYLDIDTPEKRDMEPIFKVLEEALRGAKKK